MLKRVLFISLSLLLGCIDPVDVEIDDYQKRLVVVEGSFTNLAELNYVRLTYAQQQAVPYNLLESRATVTVTSEEGELYEFKYDTIGYYYPEARALAYGTSGHTYTLNIKVDNKIFRSAPIAMPAPVPIDSVHFEIDENTYVFPRERYKKLHTGLNILVDYADPAAERNFLRWTFASEYEVHTQPWDYINPTTGLLDPKGCCVRCFVNEKIEQFTVTDDRLTNGKQVRGVNVLFMPLIRYLDEKHRLKVYQHSITGEAYDFSRILEQQKESTGTVFDPPPAEVSGNIHRVGMEQERVLGFFDVSGVSVREVTILRDNIDYPVAPYRFPDDCRVIKGAVEEFPVEW